MSTTCSTTWPILPMQKGRPCGRLRVVMEGGEGHGAYLNTVSLNLHPEATLAEHP